MSSELEYNNQTKESFDYFSRELPSQTKRLAPHALVIDCTGYLNTETADKGVRITDFYASIMPTWMKDVLDETVIDSDKKHPTILHEYNWWSCYPDPNSRARYEHGQLKPYWLDTLEKTARENGQGDLVPTYRKNSLWLQALCRKDGVEYARRCPNVEGFILWLLIDFIQYTEGLLDDFWNPKDVSAQEFAKSNADTVILLAKEGNRSFRAGGKQRIPLAISHYGETDLGGSRLEWTAKGGPLDQSGAVTAAQVTQGELTQAGSVDLDLPPAENGYKFELRVALKHDGKTVNTNNWSFWAFPEVESGVVKAVASGSGGDVGAGVFVRMNGSRNAPIPAGTKLLLADSMDPALADYVQQGGDCLLFSSGAVIENSHIYYPGMPNYHKLFRTIPWNAGAGNSGTVISKHPALSGYPHEAMCDLQFVWMVRDVIPMEFGPLRKLGVEPIIRAIDWYMTNLDNAYLLEFRVGKGRVLATTLGIPRVCAERIEARNLLDCLVRYAQGKQFAPAASVPKEEFLRLFGPKKQE